MQFDQDTIRDLSVYAVQKFVSNHTPLDVSIAEKARSLHLNEDQVRRVVESTNTIAFLKLREGAEDKTFEFEVASFPGVMGALAATSPSRGYVDLPTSETTMDKVAFVVIPEVPLDQSHQCLSRALYQTRAELEKVAQEHYNCVSDLERLVPILVKQADWQERLEQTAGNDFDRILSAFGKSGFEKSANEKDMVFVGKELEVARGVVDLIKQAGVLQVRKAELEGLEKKAGIGMKSLFNAAKSFVKNPVASPVTGAVVNGGIRTAGGLKGAGKSLLHDPLQATAKAAVAIPAAAIGAGIRGGVAAGSKISKSKWGIAGAVGAVGSVAAYTPNTNQRTGRPNDVWNNIYGN